MTVMSNHSEVLIVADPEGRRQTALSRGTGLALALGCNAHVVAFCHESLAALESHNQPLAEKARKTIMAVRKKDLARQLERYDLPGLRITSEIVWSKRIHEWIESRCRQRPPVVVVKTGHRTETFVYTPTDWHLIRDCSAPALIVAEHKWRKTRPILAAVDLGTRSRAKQKLNDKVIEQGLRYSEALACPLYLLHVIHFSRILTELDMIDPLAHTREIRKHLQAKVARLSSRHGIPADRILLKRGPVDKVIVSEAARLKAQLLVLGTIGRRGARGKLIGNTAEKVLMLARTDVLALKP